MKYRWFIVLAFIFSLLFLIFFFCFFSQEGFLVSNPAFTFAFLAVIISVVVFRFLRVFASFFWIVVAALSLIWTTYALLLYGNVPIAFEPSLTNQIIGVVVSLFFGIYFASILFPWEIRRRKENIHFRHIRYINTRTKLLTLYLIVISASLFGLFGLLYWQPVVFFIALFCTIVILLFKAFVEEYDDYVVHAVVVGLVLIGVGVFGGIKIGRMVKDPIRNYSSIIATFLAMFCYVLSLAVETHSLRKHSLFYAEVENQRCYDVLPIGSMEDDRHTPVLLFVVFILAVYYVAGTSIWAYDSSFHWHRGLFYDGLEEHSFVLRGIKNKCTEEAMARYSCSVCGARYEEPVAPSEHSYFLVSSEPPTCEEEGMDTYICSECGDVHTECIEATGHTPSKGMVIIIGATSSSDGIAYYQCEKCGKEYSEVVKYTGE